VTPTPIAEFDGEVVRVKTMADGSPRFEFGAGEPAISVMQVLAQAQSGRYLHVIVFDEKEWREFEQSQLKTIGNNSRNE